MILRKWKQSSMHKTGFRISKLHILKTENTCTYFGYCLLPLWVDCLYQQTIKLCYIAFFICRWYNTVHSDTAWSKTQHGNVQELPHDFFRRDYTIAKCFGAENFNNCLAIKYLINNNNDNNNNTVNRSFNSLLPLYILLSTYDNAVQQSCICLSVLILPENG